MQCKKKKKIEKSEKLSLIGQIRIAENIYGKTQSNKENWLVGLLQKGKNYSRLFVTFFLPSVTCFFLPFVPVSSDVTKQQAKGVSFTQSKNNKPLKKKKGYYHTSKRTSVSQKRIDSFFKAKYK